MAKVNGKFVKKNGTDVLVTTKAVAINVTVVMVTVAAEVVILVVVSLELLLEVAVVCSSSIYGFDDSRWDKKRYNKLALLNIITRTQTRTKTTMRMIMMMIIISMAVMKSRWQWQCGRARSIKSQLIESLISITIALLMIIMTAIRMVMMIM